MGSKSREIDRKKKKRQRERWREIEKLEECPWRPPVMVSLDGDIEPEVSETLQVFFLSP